MTVPETDNLNIHTIPAGVPFAASLARGLLSLAGGPEQLSRAIILVPSRRAAETLREAFLEEGGAGAMLLPRIDPIGDVEDDSPEALTSAIEGHELPPPMDPLKRQLWLARLIRGFRLGGAELSLPQTLLLADALARLLDSLCDARADADKLVDLVPERYAMHWQDILKLLTILVDRWPAILAEEGVLDERERQNRLIEMRAAVWREDRPNDLIVVAGSTGTLAATRNLMACVAGLENGHVVLPGLDCEQEEQWELVVADQGHPQHRMAVFLNELGLTPDGVTVWPDAAALAGQAALRRALMSEVFRPAPLTTNWRDLPRARPELGGASLDGLSIVECPDRMAEAGVIALAMREVLESEGRTAALVTPDRPLAEAVIALLGRWDVRVEDAAGRPLAQTSLGGFLQLLVNALDEDFAPVALLALLKHPFSAGGMARRDFLKLARRLETELLRGYRPYPGIKGIIKGLDDRKAERRNRKAKGKDSKTEDRDEKGDARIDELRAFVKNNIELPLAPLIEVWARPAPSLADLARGLGDSAERMAAQCVGNAEGNVEGNANSGAKGGPKGTDAPGAKVAGGPDPNDGAWRLWEAQQGKVASRLLVALVEHGGDFDAEPASFARILAMFMDEAKVRASVRDHPRLSIHGPFEARMNHADRIILGGFNESVWPPRAELDPWMNAEMRQNVGLEPYNWRTGLSAHDVWMAACSKEVMITRSARDADSVTIPSRWLERLEAVLAALDITDVLDRGRVWLDMLGTLTPEQPFEPVARPRPAPPVTARPRRFSATEIDRWIDDPYSIYARKILNLHQQDQLDKAPDPALRGSLVHEVLRKFLEEAPDGPLGKDAYDLLESIGRCGFEPYWRFPAVRHFWWPAFQSIARWFIEEEGNRRQAIKRSHCEVDGVIEIAGPAGGVAFTARADRIDQMQDGGLVVLDYKTGKPPTAREVASERRTQLLVESLIAEEGGFGGVSAAAVRGMEYWQITGKRDEPGKCHDVRPDAWDAKAARRKLEALVAEFDDATRSYDSHPDPDITPAFPVYDHLARVDEWQIAENEGKAKIRGVTEAQGATDAPHEGFDAETAGDASKNQEAASDPDSSVFVSANAGTGKTKLLTDRVLRLMLHGAAPQSILCITFTKAAAAEMRNRISAKLARWTVAESNTLLDELAEMGFRAPSQKMIARARSLFAEILDTEDGPRVETMHSFCASVLRRFPLEAGIVPNAEVADELAQARMRAQAREELLRADNTELGRVIAQLAEQTSEFNIDQLLGRLLSMEGRLDDEEIVAKLARHFTETLKVDIDTDIETLGAKVVGGLDVEALAGAGAALAASPVESHRKRGAAMELWAGMPQDERLRRVDLLEEALFTKTGPRSERSLSNAAIRSAFPPIDKVQMAAQQVLAEYLSIRAVRRSYELSTALYSYGRAFQAQYDIIKKQRGLLDFNDLIRLTNAMLSRGGASKWVAWKLDNAIRHILLDEAQDTSPEQWRFLRCLGDEFFEADDSGEFARTMFVVGDFKQSIYSFQGADPAVMGENKVEIETIAAEHDSALREVALDVSFRSAAPILDVVNAAMPDLPGITDERLGERLGAFQTHRTARLQAGGFVEVWPVVEDDSEIPNIPGFTVPPIRYGKDAAAISASRLADKLVSWIGKRIMPSGRAMRAGDIMILMRSRGSYYRQVLAALQQADIPVAGADRMKLQDQIEIQDLLAFGDVMLLPQDDLQMAAVLKSPIFDIDEKTLFDLAHDRDNASIHSRVMAHLEDKSGKRGGTAKAGKAGKAAKAGKAGAGATQTPLARAAGMLRRFAPLADGTSVFAFYSALLADTRKHFRRRLGAAVDESLDQFLALAQAFAIGGGVSLTEFLALVRSLGGEIKREMDAANPKEVRVMTIHGAKGLEAPVVILPDLLKQRSPPDQLAKCEDSGFVYWSPVDPRPDFVTAARERAKSDRAMEENRLLYVALTRAREGLIIGGWDARYRRTLKESHYELLHSAVSGMSGVEVCDDGTLLLRSEAGVAGPVEGVGSTQKAGKGDASADSKAGERPRAAAPNWLEKIPKSEPMAGKFLRPSGPAAAPGPGRISRVFVQARDGAMSRGTLAHRLFEVLPNMAADKREAAAMAMVKVQRQVDEKVGLALVGEVLATLRSEELAGLFGPDSLAEATVSGMVKGFNVSGQVDRMSVTPERVLLADFKTGRIPTAAPPGYVRQMALYADLAAQIYPGREITTWLVWSSGPKIEEITAEQRRVCLEELVKTGGVVS